MQVAIALRSALVRTVLALAIACGGLMLALVAGSSPLAWAAVAVLIAAVLAGAAAGSVVADVIGALVVVGSPRLGYSRRMGPVARRALACGIVALLLIVAPVVLPSAAATLIAGPVFTGMACGLCWTIGRQSVAASC